MVPPNFKMLKIDIIAGARPNFMKIAPIIEAIKISQHAGKAINFRLIHTGQHYDQKMSGSFFEELGIPQPDVNLGAGGGSQAEQTAAIMIGYEKLLAAKPADLCLVVGDVTSTMACAIVAKKANMQVAHVEAGIRSGDLTMPEEINRLVTDAITDVFFTTSEVANQNLLKAGVPPEKIVFVGNTMIDTLLKNLPKLKKPSLFEENKLTEGKYFVLTLHRPANVDGEAKLKEIIEQIVQNTAELLVIFPVHPRTKKNLESLGINFPNLIYTDPLGYLEFNYLVKNAKAVITDSGGITEETTVLGIPCLTLRDNTERPETITIGTNELIGTNPKNIKPALEKLFAGNWKKGGIPALWDGQAAVRIVDWLAKN
jgi:UDP-N-acetylglucosamine 2-epimerase (non-hydrolysing)